MVALTPSSQQVFQYRMCLGREFQDVRMRWDISLFGGFSKSRQVKRSGSAEKDLQQLTFYIFVHLDQRKVENLLTETKGNVTQALKLCK